MTLEGVWWLASYPKSGNTWLRMLFTAYWTGGVDINANTGLTVSDSDMYTYGAVSPLALEKLEHKHFLFFRNAVLMHLIAARRKSPLLMKTHNSNISVDDFRLIPPELTLGAVYLVRDPRDVVCSFARHLNQTINQTIALLEEDQAILATESRPVPSWLTSWSRHVDSWDRPQALRVRYEDLKEDTEGWFTKILEHIGETVDAERVRAAVKMCALTRLREQEDKYGFIERGKQERFFGGGKGWQNELTTKQANRIEEDHGEMMSHMGYL